MASNLFATVATKVKSVSQASARDYDKVQLWVDLGRSMQRWKGAGQVSYALMTTVLMSVVFFTNVAKSKKKKLSAACV